MSEAESEKFKAESQPLTPAFLPVAFRSLACEVA
jgi:hypothetical protein